MFNLSNGIFKDETRMHLRARKVQQIWSQVACRLPIIWKAKTVKTRSISFLIYSCSTTKWSYQWYDYYVTLPTPGVSNSTCSVGHMRMYKVNCGPHYNADATTAVPELTRKSFCIYISC